MNRATCRYQSVLENDNQEVCELLMRLSESHKRWGFGLMFKWLRRQGYS
jgi:putative transposase